MTTSLPVPVESLREVGGYRVVRQLSAGRHDITLLVHDDERPWIVRVITRECPLDRVDREVEVSDLINAGPATLRDHVGAVVDLCTIDDGRLALVTEYLGGPRLDALLHDRHGDLTLGEAVTLLAPLVTAVEEGHRIGITGLPLDTAGVRLRRSGAPVWARVSEARAGPAVPERFRHREPAYAADRGRLDQLGLAVASALAIADQPALLAALGRSAGGLDRALFELADPLPVRFTRQATVSTPAGAGSSPLALAIGAVGAELRDGGSTDTTVAPSALDRRVDAALTTLESLGLPASVMAAVRAAAASVGGMIERLAVLRRRAGRPQGGEVRRGYRLAGLAGAVALLAAIAVAQLPIDERSDSTQVTDDENRSQGDEGQARAGGAEESTRQTVVGLPETELHPEPDQWSGVVEQLVQRWLNCAPSDEAEASVGGDQEVDLQQPDCAADTVHGGSAAARLITVADERHALLRAWWSDNGAVVVVERMGAAVLVDLINGDTTTASLLMVRSEAGWRIRDVIG